MFCSKELDSSDIDANARFFASVATASTSHSAGEASLSSFSFPLVTWREGGGGGGGGGDKRNRERFAESLLLIGVTLNFSVALSRGIRRTSTSGTSSILKIKGSHHVPGVGGFSTPAKASGDFDAWGEIEDPRWNNSSGGERGSVGGSTNGGIKTAKGVSLGRRKSERVDGKVASSESYKVGVAENFREGLSGLYSGCPTVGGWTDETSTAKRRVATRDHDSVFSGETCSGDDVQNTTINANL